MKLFCGVVPLDFSPVDDAVVEAYRSLPAPWVTRRVGSLLITAEQSREADHQAAGSVQMFGDTEIHTIGGRDVGEKRAAAETFNSYCDTPTAPPFDSWRGEFALAFADAARRIVLLARDHLGTRPLYWSIIGRDLVFGSLASMVAHHPEYRFGVDRQGVMLGILEADGELERTSWHSISRVPAGSWIRWRRGKIDSRRYWKPNVRSVKMTRSDAVEGYRHGFIRAVRRRCREGRTGAFLSGGLDSSAVVCAAAADGLELPTYTLRFPGDDLADEGRFVDLVLRKYGLENTAIEIIAPASVPLWREKGNTGSPDVFYYPNLQMLEPLYAAAARDGIDRLLDGLAGDHLLNATAAPLDLMAAAVRSGRPAAATQVWVDWPLIDPVGRARSAARLLLRRVAPPLLRFLWSRRKAQFPAAFVNLTGLPPGWLARALYPPRRPALLNQTKQSTAESMTSRWNLERWMEMNYLLAHCHGIEQYSPYTDIDFVEFILSVPIEHLFDPFQPRWLQREAMRGILPEEIRLRNDKGDFDRVITVVLREHLIPAARTFFETNGVDASRLAVDQPALERWMSMIMDGTGTWETSLFLEVLNYERWLREVSSGAVLAPRGA